MGPAQDIGDSLCYMILTKDTKKIVYRSNVRSAMTPINKRITPNFDSAEAEIPPNVMHSTLDFDDSTEVKLPVYSPDKILGLSFLRDQDDGTRVRAEVYRKVLDKEAAEHQQIKFILKIGDGELEELISYSALADIIEQQHEEEAQQDPNEKLWTFTGVLDHEGPLKPSDDKYKGSSYNVLILWDNGEKTWEPLEEFVKDDPLTLAIYAKEHGLLDKPRWKRLMPYARREKKLSRLLKQAQAFKLKTKRSDLYMFGVKVPRNAKEAYALDAKNGNTIWKDAIDKEIAQLIEYDTFKDLGIDGKAPDGYQQIPVHFIFAVKHDLRHKARLVAGGHLTKDPEDGSAYSGVVSLRTMRIAVLLAELNGLSIHAADVGNAYLEATTKEKVYTVAGPEFGPLEGHTLVIYKALYGLKTSGAAFHACFADTLRDMEFWLLKNEPDIWMRNGGDHWEYVCVYVDDLLIMMCNPELFLTALQSAPHNYMLKGFGPPSYHLGGDFYRDDDGTLCWGAKSYVKKMLSTYETLYGTQPREYSAPLEKGDHPELDLTPELNADGIKQYQSLIGAFQWSISLCRFDISIAVMTLGRFRTAPREGHLDRVKRIVGYLKKHPDAAIRFRTGRPAHADVEIPNYSWLQTVYGDMKEELPDDLPPALGCIIRLTSYVYANLYHDMITGRSVTGIVHMINQTPINWYSKHQATVETATYCSEFVATRIAVEQIMDLHYTLMYLGVKLDGPVFLFSDNQSVITSSTVPHSTLSKRHNALAYHRVREAVAAGVIYFIKIEGVQNPADALRKFLPYVTWWPLIQPMLYWKGDTFAPLDVQPNVPEGSVGDLAHIDVSGMN